MSQAAGSRNYPKHPVPSFVSWNIVPYRLGHLVTSRVAPLTSQRANAAKRSVARSCGGRLVFSCCGRAPAAAAMLKNGGVGDGKPRRCCCSPAGPRESFSVVVEAGFRHRHSHAAPQRGTCGIHGTKRARRGCAWPQYPPGAACVLAAAAGRFRCRFTWPTASRARGCPRGDG